MAAAVGDIMEVVFQSRLHDQELRNVRHYRLAAISGSAGAPDADSATALGAAMETLWNVVRNNLSIQLTLAGILVQRVNPAPRTAGIFRVVNNPSGQEDEASLPTSVAVVTRLRTDFAGRSFRGRNYWAGVPLSFEEESRLTAGATTAWEVAADGFVVTLAPAAVNGRVYTFQPVLYRKSSGVFTPLTNSTVDPVLRNQRRRQSGKGI